MLCIQFEATPVKRAEFNSFGALSPVYAKNNVIFVKNLLQFFLKINLILKNMFYSWFFQANFIFEKELFALTNYMKLKLFICFTSAFKEFEINKYSLTLLLIRCGVLQFLNEV